MKRFWTWWDCWWHKLLIAGVVGLQALVFLYFREESYLTVQDHLDLFVAHFQVLNHWDAWFSHGVQVPLLGGIDRGTRCFFFCRLSGPA